MHNKFFAYEWGKTRGMDKRCEQEIADERRERNEGLNAPYCFDMGEECYLKEDYVKAVEWYTLAAEKGDAEAQYSLGYCFDNGHGVPRDFKTAAIWYRKASEQGHKQAAECLKKLGIIY